MKDGGRVFPIVFDNGGYEGITYRDLAALMAMQGMIAAGNSYTEAGDMARLCYAMADAMVAEKEKRDGGGEGK